MTHIKGIGITLSGIDKVETETDDELGAIFREMRASLGLDIAELAVQLDTQPDTLHALENGDISVLPVWDELTPVVSRYASALKLDPDPLHRRIALGLSNQKSKTNKKAEENTKTIEAPKAVESSLIEKLNEQNKAITGPAKAHKTRAEASLTPNLQKRLDELTKNHPDNTPNPAVTMALPDPAPTPQPELQQELKVPVLPEPLVTPSSPTPDLVPNSSAASPSDIKPAPFVHGQVLSASRNDHQHSSDGLPENLPTAILPNHTKPVPKTSILANMIYLLGLVSCGFLFWVYYTDPSAFTGLFRQILG